MFSGLSFRSAFVFSINSILILSGFPLTSLYLAEANLVPRAILKNQESIFRLPLTAKRRAGVKVEVKPHYLLFRGFTFLFVQLSKKSKNVFFTKKNFFSTHFAINLFFA